MCSKPLGARRLRQWTDHHFTDTNRPYADDGAVHNLLIVLHRAPQRPKRRVLRKLIGKAGRLHEPPYAGGNALTTQAQMDGKLRFSHQTDPDGLSMN
jgi:hypothetical protein